MLGQLAALQQQAGGPSQEVAELDRVMLEAKQWLTTSAAVVDAPSAAFDSGTGQLQRQDILRAIQLAHAAAATHSALASVLPREIGHAVEAADAAVVGLRALAEPVQVGWGQEVDSRAQEMARREMAAKLGELASLNAILTDREMVLRCSLEWATAQATRVGKTNSELQMEAVNIAVELSSLRLRAETAEVAAAAGGDGPCRRCCGMQRELQLATAAMDELDGLNQRQSHQMLLPSLQHPATLQSAASLRQGLAAASSQLDALGAMNIQLVAEADGMQAELTAWRQRSELAEGQLRQLRRRGEHGGSVESSSTGFAVPQHGVRSVGVAAADSGDDVTDLFVANYNKARAGRLAQDESPPIGAGARPRAVESRRSAAAKQPAARHNPRPSTANDLLARHRSKRASTPVVRDASDGDDDTVSTKPARCTPRHSTANDLLARHRSKRAAAPVVAVDGPVPMARRAPRHSTADDLLARHRSKRAALPVVRDALDGDDETVQPKLAKPARRRAGLSFAPSIEEIQTFKESPEERRAKQQAAAPALALAEQIMADNRARAGGIAERQTSQKRSSNRSPAAARRSTAAELLSRHRVKKAAPAAAPGIAGRLRGASAFSEDSGDEADEEDMPPPPPAGIAGRLRGAFDPSAFSDEEEEESEEEDMPPPPPPGIAAKLRGTFDPFAFSDEDEDEANSTVATMANAHTARRTVMVKAARRSTAAELLARHRVKRAEQLQARELKQLPPAAAPGIAGRLRGAFDPSAFSEDSGDEADEEDMPPPPPAGIAGRLRGAFDPSAFSDEEEEESEEEDMPPPPPPGIAAKLRGTFDPFAFSDEDEDEIEDEAESEEPYALTPSALPGAAWRSPSSSRTRSPTTATTRSSSSEWRSSGSPRQAAASAMATVTAAVAASARAEMGMWRTRAERAEQDLRRASDQLANSKAGEAGRRQLEVVAEQAERKAERLAAVERSMSAELAELRDRAAAAERQLITLQRVSSRTTVSSQPSSPRSLTAPSFDSWGTGVATRTAAAAVSASPYRPASRPPPASPHNGGYASAAMVGRQTPPRGRPAALSSPTRSGAGGGGGSRQSPTATSWLEQGWLSGDPFCSHKLPVGFARTLSLTPPLAALQSAAGRTQTSTKLVKRWSSGSASSRARPSRRSSGGRRTTAAAGPRETSAGRSKPSVSGRGPSTLGRRLGLGGVLVRCSSGWPSARSPRLAGLAAARPPRAAAAAAAPATPTCGWRPRRSAL